MLAEFLRDHRVQGAPVLPGAAAIELVLAARGLERARLEGVTFLRPLVADAGGALESRLEIEGDAFRLVDPKDRRPFVLGRFAPPRDPPAQSLDARALCAHLTETLDPEEIYRWFRGMGLEYGPLFRTLREIRRAGSEVWAKLAVDQAAGPFILHPSILDGALQAIGCVAYGEPEALFLPFSIDAIDCFHRVGASAEVHARVTSASSDLVLADIQLFDPSGRLLVRLSKASVKRIPAPRTRAAVPSELNGLLHQRILRAAPSAEPAATASGAWTAFGDPELASRVRSPRIQVPGSTSDGPSPEIERIVYCAGRSPTAALDLIRFARSALATPGALKAMVVIAQASIPESEAALAVARSLRLERPDLSIRAIALGDGVPPDRLADELDQLEPEVVLDASGRSIWVLEPLQVSGPAFTLPRGASCLVTGGLGGVGLTLAGWLFERFGARITLLGRRSLDRVPEAARVVERLRAAGAEILVLAADSSDPASLAAALSQSRAQFGRIEAVFHAAGAIRDALLSRKSDVDAAQVLNPKIAGTELLDRLTQADAPRLVVLISSLTSYSGNVGQTDYAAANRYLDAYARRARRDGRPFTSVAFGPWSEVGMAAAIAERARAHGIEPLSPRTAVLALEQALSSGAGEVLAARVSADAARWTGMVFAGPAPATSAPAAKALPPKAKPSGAPSPKDTGALESMLSKEFARFLDVPAENLDPDADFQEYGVDSIFAVQILRELEQRLGRTLDPAMLFEHRTLRSLAGKLAELAPAEPSSETAPAEVAVTRIDVEAATPEVEPAPQPSPEPAARQWDAAPPVVPSPSAPSAIAVIGYAARIPGMADLDAFFDALLERRSVISEVPATRFPIERYYDPTGERPGTTHSKWGTFLEGLDRFDPLYFGISPREAALLDPQQRLLLEVCWGAAEQAGYGPKLARSKTGVFVTGAPSDYGRRFLSRPESIDAHTAIGNMTSLLANRVSYSFDLRGPSLALDTACSSSLVALHLARESLLRGESKLALVAGVNVLLTPELFVAFSRGRLLSPTGRCRPFGAGADGYVRAEGAAALLLKPLEDALADGDTIHGLLIGSGVSQDGRTPGLTTPSAEAQAEAMRAAWRGIDPRTIDYLEAHAVGSPIGDPLELEALTAAGASCSVGSMKGSFGHAEVVAGLIAVIKVLLAFRRGTMPPLAEASALRHPGLRFQNEPTPIGPRFRAAVNAFGFGGTNASALLERFDVPAPASDAAGEHLLLLSARSQTSLSELAARFDRFLSAPPSDDLADVCFTQATGRRPETFRAALLGDRSGLRVALKDVAPSRAGKKPTVAFLFTGQGSQYAQMGRALYDQSPVFRAAIERCSAVLDGELERPLLEVIYRPADPRAIDQTGYTQPALFALEWALAETWRAAGVQPAFVLGHSVGEIVAAAVAGVLSLEDALHLTKERARLLQALPTGGAMAAVTMSASEIQPLIDPHRGRVDLAAINGPRSTVISGEAASVAQILEQVAQLGHRSHRLTVSHAFHSPLVEPMLADFERFAGSLRYAAPHTTLVSNLFGRALTQSDVIDASYWVRHVRAPVRFFDGLSSISADLFLELGPDAVLSGLGKAALGEKGAEWVPSLRRGADDRRTLLGATARLFVKGVDVDPSVFEAPRRRVPIPQSVMEPRRIWFEDATPTPAPAIATTTSLPAKAQLAKVPAAARPDLEAWISREVARLLDLQAADVSLDTPLRSFGLDSLLALELAARLEARLGRKAPLESLPEDISIRELVLEIDRALPDLAAPSDPAEAPTAPPRLAPLDPDAYARFARPATMERLTAGALAKVYTEARGDRLFFEENGRRVEVLDCLGGFGCTLFGHNHPELVACLTETLAAATPTHAQGAHHLRAGALAARLSERMERLTGKRFVSTFVNTGSEAVEVAIKHAEAEYAARADAFTTATHKDLARTLHDFSDLPLDENVGTALGLPHGATLGQAIIAIEAHNAQVLAERPTFFALDRSFHGKTSGAARLTAGDGYRTRYSAGIRVERVPAGDLAALEAKASALKSDLFGLAIEAGSVSLVRRPWTRAAALFIEPVQGEGGVRPLAPADLAGLRALADAHRLPIVIDEIQSGFGRCGAFSAAHALGLSGDYYLFGKALGGGLAKIAVLMVDERRYVREVGLSATSTFSEDDPSTIVALKALEIYDQDDIEGRSKRIGARLLRRLEEVQRRYPEVIREVRGMGLLIGVELADLGSSASTFLRHTEDELGHIAASWFLNVARIRFFPMSSATNTIRFEPSAYLSEADEDRIVAAVERFSEIVERGNVAHLVGPLVGYDPGNGDSIRDWRHAAGHEAVPAQPGDRRVAFVTYFTEDDDLLDFCPAFEELPVAPRLRALAQLHRVLPPRVVRSARITSKTGRQVHVELIGIFATSALIEASLRSGELEWIRDRVDQAVDLAIARGAEAVGFGGLTSIVTHNSRLAATTRVALTTGNALTVAMGIEAVRRGCLGAGIDLSSARLAVVGAAGNIGAIYAECMADVAARLILVGRDRSRARLEALAARLYQQAFERLCQAPVGVRLSGLAAALFELEPIRRRAERRESTSGEDLRRLIEQLTGNDAPIAIADELAELRRASVILSASNASRPIIEPEHLGPGPLVLCDVAVPRDVSPRVTQLRPDATVLVGGAVQLPKEVNLDLVAGHLPRGHVYACMAETMLLGLDGRRSHLSFGAIRREDVETAAALAEAHGFELGLVRSQEASTLRPTEVERRAHDRARDV